MATTFGDRSFGCGWLQHPTGRGRTSTRFSPIAQLILYFVLHVTTMVALGSSSGTPQQRHLGRFLTHFEPLQYDLVEARHGHTEYQWRRTQNEDYSFVLQFEAYGQVLNLQLEQDSELYHADITLQTGHGQQFEMDLSQQVVGVVSGYKESFVHGSIVGGRFRGVIEADNETYHVEPSRAFFNDSQEFHSIIYRDRDVNHTLAMNGKGLDSSAIVRQVLDQVEQQRSSGRRRVRRQVDASLLKYVECQISVVGDHFFAEVVAKEEGLSINDGVAVRAAMVRVMSLYVREASKILERTTFLSTSSAPEGVRLAILSATTYLTVTETATFGDGKTKLKDQFIGVDPLLLEFSKANWERYCASYLFTFRSFDDGVLGLAWVNRLCRKHNPKDKGSLNTGLITLSFQGERIPSATSRLVFIHEVGHNFGATHDDGAACLPSDKDGGKYIMFANANDGSMRNNYKFSSCSISRMERTLETFAFTGSSLRCFKPHSNGSICSNRVREKEEACDCGTAAQCQQESFCCTTNCALAPNSTCSPQQGPCCSSSLCSFVPASANKICSESHECRVSQSRCNGTTSVCPTPPPRPNGLVCNKGRSTCQDGECTGSLCGAFNLTRCFCSGADACHVCCSHRSKCVPLSGLVAFNFNVSGLHLYLLPGSPCNDFQGTCNFLHFCRQVGDSTSLLAIQNFLFSKSTYAAAYNWLKSYWWAATLAFFGLVVMFVIIVKLCAYKTPQKVLNPNYKSNRPRSQTETITLPTTLEEEDTL